MISTYSALASSALADVAHQIRDKLTLDQISVIIYMYSQNMHDNTLEPKIQTIFPIRSCPFPIGKLVPL